MGNVHFLCSQPGSGVAGRGGHGGGRGEHRTTTSRLESRLDYTLDSAQEDGSRITSHIALNEDRIGQISARPFSHIFLDRKPA